MEITDVFTKINLMFPDLLEVLDSFVIVIDIEKKILVWNKSAENCFFVPAEIALNNRLEKLPIIWDSELVYEFLEKSCHTGENFYIPDIQIETADNKKKWIGAKIYNVKNTDGCVFFIVGIDITEKKKNFEIMKEDSKFKAIGELSAGIAHEINSPLQYIHNNLTFLENVKNKNQELNHDLILLKIEKEKYNKIALLKKILKDVERIPLDELATEANEAIKQSLEGINRIETIVRSLKNYAHPESEKPVKTSLNEIIQDAVTLTVNEWKYVADVKTKTGENVNILGYPTYLSQVIVNLLCNASHAVEEMISIGKMKRGEINIALFSDDKYASIMITDNGIGMSEDIRKRIFEPFFTTKGIGKGTGQGLAIAYSTIVNKHDGEIICNSKIGEGSEFVIKLPMLI